MTKLCECGCGLPAPISLYTDTPRGYFKGKPRRFIIGHNRRSGPLVKEFWAKVNKKGPVPSHVPMLGNCWVWLGDSAGSKLIYGRIKVDGKREQAHRVAWFLETGSMPRLWVLHKCDNPLCVRFSHLFEGDVQANADDKSHRNRNATGEQNGSAKLSQNQVQSIRKELAKGTPQRAIARMYAVHQSTVGRINQNLLWRGL